jgi:hypothetical protein
VPADYSMLMPIVVKALLEKRARFERWAERMGREALFKKHPAARGYLRDTQGYRLYDRREELVERLLAAVAKDRKRMEKECRYALAKVEDAAAPSPAKPAEKSLPRRAKPGAKTGAKRRKS